ncbi:MAG: hypothetical protein HZC19_00045, partial [Candidatus Omnitrophica bacterium]|nr:hypothetical protein [Candidatus Omnitrophota bacterium]
KEEMRDRAEKADIFKTLDKKIEETQEKALKKDEIERDNQLERALDLMKALKVYKS